MLSPPRASWRIGFSVLVALAAAAHATARPVYVQGLADYLGPFTAKNFVTCRTCHLAEKPTDEDHEHNLFGARLVDVKKPLRAAGKKIDLTTRLDAIANEDADGDGVSNLIELLSGHHPGDPADKPSSAEIANVMEKTLPAFRKFRAAYPWKPFEVVKRPKVPAFRDPAGVRNPIDAFLSTACDERGLKPRPEAPRHVILRRVYIDLIGLPPTPEEIEAALSDKSPDWFEKVVDRLLDLPQYGERWGRHWMDVWRYSDVDGTGNQIYSQPHIWRWRDWIVESLNEDKPYDRMILEMLAADELAPEDPKALRATGFLVRNFNGFYPQVWLQDTVEYTSQALLGLTLKCARCHDHMYDPITQKEYYQVTAIFQPQGVRTDALPGQPDPKKDGLVRVFDGNPKAETFLFVRGDLQKPEKTPSAPGVPAALGGKFPAIEQVNLPRSAYAPEKRAFVIQQTVAGSEAALQQARQLAARQEATSVAAFLLAEDGVRAVASLPAVERAIDAAAVARADAQLAETRHAALLGVLRAEKLEDDGQAESDPWKEAATEAARLQRELAVLAARKNVLLAQQGKRAIAKGMAVPKLPDAEKALAKAEADAQAPLTTKYTKREIKSYPFQSSGRRLAFARWIADAENPLTARVAMNHLWLRHFGQPIVPRVFDFGKAGPPPTHPALLDWLAAEFMDKGWSMKAMHKLMVTSSAYRMASTPDPAAAAIDPDNKYFWRVPSRRIEAEVIRDTVFALAGKLDLTMGGPDIDHGRGLDVPRRSLYFRHAEDKQVGFLKIFDGASAIERYQRPESTVPQQALAMANSDLTRAHARIVAQALASRAGKDPAAFARAAFERVLCRPPTTDELAVCTEFFQGKTEANAFPRACEKLVHGLLNHYEFRTLR